MDATHWLLAKFAEGTRPELVHSCQADRKPIPDDSMRVEGREHLLGVQVGPGWCMDAQRGLGNGHILAK